MADSDELRLIGTFQNKISPGLKSSIDKIRAFTKEGERAGADGARATTKHAEAFARRSVDARMVRIAISVEAFEAIARTLRVGSVRFSNVVPMRARSAP
jgi:hypothetical protein